MDTLPANPVLLKSWKEIAAYLRCSVRTAQRYEHERHLPVRRSAGRGSVLALKGDLDMWLRNTPVGSLKGTVELRSGPIRGGPSSISS